MRKQASPAPVEIQTDSSMLEIRMQGVYSLLQLAIISTCQLLPNKVVMRPDVRHPWPPADDRLFDRMDGEAVQWQLVTATSGRPCRQPLQLWGRVVVRQQLFTSSVRQCYLGENNLLALRNQNSEVIINLSSKIHNQVKVYYEVIRVEKVIVPEGKKNNDLVWPS
jgi:hypothetical protein